jgi:iron-sulfur cluster assembly protein
VDCGGLTPLLDRRDSMARGVASQASAPESGAGSPSSKITDVSQSGRLGNRPSVEKVALGRGARLVLAMDSAVNALSPAPVALRGSAPEARTLPEGVREGNENLVLLTAPAGAKVATLIAREAKGEYLRIAISGGGCNGLSYKMKFVPEPKRGDILVRTGNTRVVVDSKSALYLKGTQVDYSGALVAGGFKFSNPNAKASCSCGESFSI